MKKSKSAEITKFSDFLAHTKNIEEGKIFTMFFVDSDDVDSAGNFQIRALFSYARAGTAIVFKAVGLTESSSGDPYTHYGLIKCSRPMQVWRFEEIDFSCELAVAKPCGPEIWDFEEAEEDPEDEIPHSPKLIKTLKSVEEKQWDYYYVDDSDESQYRLNSKFTNLVTEEGWIEEGFEQSVYQVAQSVLLTAAGYSW